MEEANARETLTPPRQVTAVSQSESISNERMVAGGDL
jgi:hypothetical protein